MRDLKGSASLAVIGLFTPSYSFSLMNLSGIIIKCELLQSFRSHLLIFDLQSRFTGLHVLTADVLTFWMWKCTGLLTLISGVTVRINII